MVLAGATDPDGIACVDVDDTIRETHGYQKQGVGYGYSKVKGLNAQLATLSSPTCAPVIAATGCAGATPYPGTARTGSSATPSPPPAPPG
jgi:hypothetical protein